jgi:hypothetical protein
MWRGEERGGSCGVNRREEEAAERGGERKRLWREEGRGAGMEIDYTYSQG